MSTNIVIFFMNPSYLQREFSKNILDDVSKQLFFITAYILSIFLSRENVLIARFFLLKDCHLINIFSFLLLFSKIIYIFARNMIK